MFAPKDFLEVSTFPFLFFSNLQRSVKERLSARVPRGRWLSAQVLISLRNPNYDSSEDVGVRSHWGLIQVPLDVRDIPQLVGGRPSVRD